MDEERRKGPDRRMYAIDVQVARLEEKLSAAERALTLATVDIDRRLTEMNEMRDQINQERGGYLLRREFESKYEMLLNSVASLQKFQWGVTGALLAFQLLVGMIIHYWH